MMFDSQHSQISRFIAEAAAVQLSRRQVIGRGLALGLSVSTITALLAARPENALAVGGGTMKIAFTLDLQFLDPQLVQSDQDLLPSTLIFSRLVQWDATMLDPKPDVAESWTISDDNLTYVFTLRPGTKFHSGREVTADDVVFSFQRALDTGDPVEHRRGPSGRRGQRDLAQHLPARPGVLAQRQR